MFPRRLLIAIVILLLGVALESCEKQVCEDLYCCEPELDELELMELLILPCDPDNGDEISVMEKICGTESEVLLSFEGNRIGYLRYVNSLMMAPCSPQLDTTVLGQLSSGTYMLLHSVIDLNHQISDSIILQDTITLLVSE